MIRYRTRQSVSRKLHRSATAPPIYSMGVTPPDQRQSLEAVCTQGSARSERALEHASERSVRNQLAHSTPRKRRYLQRCSTSHSLPNTISKGKVETVSHRDSAQ
jgi:hypothetical protein